MTKPLLVCASSCISFDSCVRAGHAPVPGVEVCALCNRQTRPSDRLRPVRALHFHWARLMELDSERHWLSGVFEKGEVVAWWDGVCSAQGMSGAR